DSYAKDTLGRIRAYLGTDLLVLGSYVALGGQLRLDLRLQDAVTGQTLAASGDTGSEDDLFALVSRAGEQLRQRLGVGKVPASEALQRGASFPHDPQAAS